MAVGTSASSVRMKMLTAPVARFAAMNTGNMFKFIAARICDIGRCKLADKRAQDGVTGVNVAFKYTSRNHFFGLRSLGVHGNDVLEGAVKGSSQKWNAFAVLTRVTGELKAQHLVNTGLWLRPRSYAPEAIDDHQKDEHKH